LTRIDREPVAKAEALAALRVVLDVVIEGARPGALPKPQGRRRASVNPAKMPFSNMTAPSADFRAWRSSPVPRQFRGADSEYAIRLGWLSGIGLGRI
jgi:hypothetical protein